MTIPYLNIILIQKKTQQFYKENKEKQIQNQYFYLYLLFFAK